MHCADTSFLCALYRQQANSERAIETLEAVGAPIVISSLLAYEFRQAVRFQVFLRSRDAKKGYSETEGLMVLAQFENDLDSGVIIEAGANWTDVAAIVERLSERHTMKRGARSFDLLHIATALQWEATVFLSFDGLQREIAAAEGLDVLPADL
ncbi:MAG: type II toxin-antitoxin system VapC family toxin [Prosthecobacter sp.]|jgi:predicted nucleic acid-binding protein|uniref:type II toxin-antitoxin system VapC family toxin n=1 Tax=Prosthecobacter sp. TaxID=1965333 RepID=UPI0019EE0C8E|nr:type II toxin-antitoxin system VapC family toxin [Prosthecobacter sp.]MBE2287898.1 type II toxin-antitoxin system VapC family toxin [Prosthecobacter sp.]